MSSIERPRALGLLTLLACCLLSGFAAAYAGAIPDGSSPDTTPGYITSIVFGAGSDTTVPLGFPADDFNGCAQCHGVNGNAPSNITINGTLLSTSATPTAFTVAQGTTTTFTVNWLNPAGKLGGGFLAMHNDLSINDTNGTLGKVGGDGTVHTCKGALTGTGSTTCNATLNNNTEVMHEVPKDNDGSSGVTFQFTYQANATTVCQTFEFGLWVNSENRDNLCIATALD